MVTLSGATRVENEWNIVGRIVSEKGWHPIQLKLTEEGEIKLLTDISELVELPMFPEKACVVFYEEKIKEEFEKVRIKLVLGKLKKRTFEDEIKFCKSANVMAKFAKEVEETGRDINEAVQNFSWVEAMKFHEHLKVYNEGMEL